MNIAFNIAVIIFGLIVGFGFVAIFMRILFAPVGFLLGVAKKRELCNFLNSRVGRASEFRRAFLATYKLNSCYVLPFGCFRIGKTGFVSSSILEVGLRKLGY